MTPGHQQEAVLPTQYTTVISSGVSVDFIQVWLQNINASFNINLNVVHILQCVQYLIVPDRSILSDTHNAKSSTNIILLLHERGPTLPQVHSSPVLKAMLYLHFSLLHYSTTIQLTALL